MSVPVELTSTWRAGTPIQILQTPYFPAGLAGFNYRPYDVSSDGKRFLMIKEIAGDERQVSASRGIVVVQNWLEELKRRVPTN